MTSFVVVIASICLFIPIYVYVGYPVLLIVLTKLKGAKEVNKCDIEPSVSLLVSCYNEAAVIQSKIENSLAIDYSPQKLEIVFISDGSDDGTDEIITQYEKQGIRLVRQEGRLGKTSGLNLAVPNCNGEIIVFSDANALYQPDAIRKLAQNFNDATVGYVVGAALYSNTEGNSAAESENSYWRYELAVKTLESKLHSVVGGDGAIYAIRSGLYETLAAEDINDFVNPLQIISRGYRGVFEPEAVCFEEAAGSFDKEAKRKERIVNRSFRGLMKVRAVMNPFKVGFFSVEVVSHKLLRWMIPLFLIGAALATAYLSNQGILLFQVALMLGIAFVWLAAIGYLTSNSEKIVPLFYYPYYFVVINISCLVGLIQAFRGNIQVTWNSSRIASNEPSPTKAKSLFLVSLFLLISVFLFIDAFTNLTHMNSN